MGAEIHTVPRMGKGCKMRLPASPCQPAPSVLLFVTSGGGGLSAPRDHLGFCMGRVPRRVSRGPDLDGCRSGPCFVAAVSAASCSSPFPEGDPSLFGGPGVALPSLAPERRLRRPSARGHGEGRGGEGPLRAQREGSSAGLGGAGLPQPLLQKCPWAGAASSCGQRGPEVPSAGLAGESRKG